MNQIYENNSNFPNKKICFHYFLVKARVSAPKDFSFEDSIAEPITISATLNGVNVANHLIIHMNIMAAITRMLATLSTRLA